MRTDEPITTPRRGRPRSHGLQPGWMLWRATEILRVFDQQRDAGEKHAAAVTNTVSELRRLHPRLPVSAGEVRRVLRSMRPASADVEWAVREIVGANGCIEHALYVRERSKERRRHLRARGQDPMR